MSHARRRAANENSLLAYYAGRNELFDKREKEVLACLRYAKDLTDREIMLACGYSDMNAVRPRITTLKKDGVIEKTGNKLDPVTGKRVRTVSLRPDPRKPQAEFSFVVTRQEAAS